MSSKHKRRGVPKRCKMNVSCHQKRPTYCENHRRKNCSTCLVNVAYKGKTDATNDVKGVLESEGIIYNEQRVEDLKQTVTVGSNIAEVNVKRRVAYRQHTVPVSTDCIFRNKRSLGRVNIKCSEDTDPIGSWVCGLVVTVDNKLIVCDYNNRAVKMVDIKRDIVTCRLATDLHPRGITIIDEDRVAVTLPDEFKIIFLRTGGSSLEEEKIIITSEQCYSIIHYSETFIASCIKPRRIVTLDMHGVTLRSFETRTEWQTYNEYPGYIALAPDKQSIYVTNTSSSCITQFTLDGQPLNEFAHYDLHGASGVAVNAMGDVYVGTWIHEKGTVVKFQYDLTQPCEFMGEKDGVLLPSPIYLDNEKGMLYLSNSLYIANDAVSIYCIRPEERSSTSI